MKAEIHDVSVSVSKIKISFLFWLLTRPMILNGMCLMLRNSRHVVRDHVQIFVISNPRISGVLDVWIGIDTSLEMFDIDSRTYFEDSEERDSRNW